MPLKRHQKYLLTRILRTDALVIGSGLAGCFAAIELNKRGIDVTILEKSIFSKSGSSVMGSRFSVHSFDPNPLSNWGGGPYVQPGLIDDPELRKKHAEQTEGNSQIAWSFVAELENMGVYFRRHPDGTIWPESGGGVHSVKTDQAGKVIMQVLGAEVKRRNIRILEMTMATRILTKNGRAVGVVALDIKNVEIFTIATKAVIMATGATSWYPTSTVPETLSGDGFAMAYRAGAELADLCELIFYNYKNPEVPPKTWRFPVASWNMKPLDFTEPEALNARGEKIWEKDEYKPLLDTARAQGMDGKSLDIPLWLKTYVNAKEIAASRGTERQGVYVSYRGLKDAGKMKDTWVRYDFFKKMGIDPAKDNIEVGVVPHIDRGGIATNVKLESVSLPGLYAIGGALAGVGGMIGCVATGKWVAESVEEIADKIEIPELDPAQIEEEENRILSFIGSSKHSQSISPPKVKRMIKRTMAEKCPYWKNEKTLKEGLDDLHKIRNEIFPKMRTESDIMAYNQGLVDALEAVNLLDLWEIHIEMSLMKKESRGFFRRLDYPEESKFFTGVRVRLVDGERKYRIVKVPIPGFESFAG
jgi:succinate dehydrogenase/fumarate reductase flavoprotein subunit